MLLSWYLYPDIEKAVRREQVMICANGIAAEQQVNCDDSQVNVASPRLNAAEQRLIATVSQVNVAEQRLNDTQSQGDDSPATPLRLTSSSAAINRSEAASLPVNLLFLSNLIPSKGVYVLLDACRRLTERGHGFVCRFVGGETKEMDRATFEAEVQRRGLEGMVRYEGPKYGEEKEEYWFSSDVFVQPTYEDCFPLTIVEAMQHGLPVVSTDEGAVPDIVVDGENGFICRRKDVEGLAQALERLITDASLRKRMGEEGYRIYKDKFTLQCFEQRFTEILMEMNG